MLEKLVIKNYLLLKNIEIDFSNRFNIITGETGAGKSILINALSLMLGERADYSIISKNKEKMIIEGFVKITNENKKPVEKLFIEHDIEKLDNDHLIVRRELYTKGYSRNFINDTPVNINELKSLGELIIDIHSQNEHQSLLKKEIHIELLDSYVSKASKTKFESELSTYKNDFHELLNLINEYNSINEKKKELDNRRSFIEFQLNEINEVNPQANEDEELENELKMSENVEGITQGLAAAYSNLYDDSGSVVERIKLVEKELSKIEQYNTDISKILKDISDSSLVLNEASRLIQSIMDNVSFDPERIEQVRERLYKLQFLKKKYGSNLAGIIKIKEELEQDLSLVDNFDENISVLENNIKSAKDNLFKKSQVLSKIRKESAKKLEDEVTGVLREVGFENADFKISITSPSTSLLKGEGGDISSLLIKSKNEHIKIHKNGIDDIEFLVKINKGDEFSSLRKTASGGEVSRIMLAVKTVLADADNVSTLVFDEIDTGISGRVAQKAGRVMKKLSEYHQVISITHLAQIAALADEHFLVEKESEGESTFTKIRKLDKNEKVIEVAKLLSGEKVTDASIKSAKELMTS